MYEKKKSWVQTTKERAFSLFSQNEGETKKYKH